MWEYIPNTIYSGLIYTEVLITSYYERRSSWTQEMLQTTVLYASVENRRQRQQHNSVLCVCQQELCRSHSDIWINGYEILNISVVVFNSATAEWELCAWASFASSCPEWHRRLWAENSCLGLLCILHEIKSPDLSQDVPVSLSPNSICLKLCDFICPYPVF